MCFARKPHLVCLSVRVLVDARVSATGLQVSGHAHASQGGQGRLRAPRSDRSHSAVELPLPQRAQPSASSTVCWQRGSGEGAS